MTASTEPRAPFGFETPSARDLGELSRMLVVDAGAALEAARRRAVLLLGPSVAFYLVFAAGVGLVLGTLGIELEANAFAAVVAAAFVAMAVLGQFYETRASFADLTGGMGRLHSVLLAQAFIVRALTAAFFAGPFRVLENLGRLFPRHPRLTSEVVALAGQLAAALDEPVATADLVAILPVDLRGGALDEAVGLLLWSGVADVGFVDGRRLLRPIGGRQQVLGRLPQGSSEVVTVSMLR